MEPITHCARISVQHLQENIETFFSVVDYKRGNLKELTKWEDKGN